MSRHASIRAFIHTSTRYCGASAVRRQPRDARPTSRTVSVALAELNNDIYPLERLQRTRPVVTERETDDGMVLRTLDSKQYVLPRPTFSLKPNPLSNHPCIGGLNLDLGLVEPAEAALSVSRRINEARSEQLHNANVEWYDVQIQHREKLLSEGASAEAQQDVDTEGPQKPVSWHWNVLGKRRAQWRAYWESTRERRELDILENDVDYAEPIAYGDLNLKASPSVTRGAKCLLMTCLDPRDIETAPSSTSLLDSLGLPTLVSELLFAFHPTSLGNALQPTLPTVIRISPARYVLTFKSTRARDTLLRGWKMYSGRVRDETGRNPPFRFEIDSGQKAPIAEQRHAAKPHVKFDRVGNYWWEDRRYSRMQDAANYLLDKTASKPTNDSRVHLSKPNAELPVQSPPAPPPSRGRKVRQAGPRWKKILPPPATIEEFGLGSTAATPDQPSLQIEQPAVLQSSQPAEEKVLKFFPAPPSAPITLPRIKKERSTIHPHIRWHENATSGKSKKRAENWSVPPELR